MKPAKLIPLTLLLVLAGCLGESHEGSFQRTLQVSGKVNLEVQSGAGNITVHTGDSQSVSIKGRIRARGSWVGMSGSAKVRQIESNPPIEQQGSTIYIGRMHDRELRNNVVITYDITVPPQTDLRSTTGAGSQMIRGIQGSLDAKTGAGNLTVEDVGGDLRLQSGAGNVNVRSPQGSLYADSGAGTVTADGNPRRDWRIKVGAGTIHLRVPPGASFDLNAQSGFGSINVNRDLNLQGSVSANRVNGKIGKGGPVVELDSGAGSIEVE